MQRRKQDEKIHLDAVGSGRQSEKDQPGALGRRSDTDAGHLPGGVGVGRAKMI